ncbi:MAG: dihydrofolate reductase [Fimbriimonadaceae bacterium]|nr:dihydrofolate reductase [Chitinophagales bacterium]
MRSLLFMLACTVLLIAAGCKKTGQETKTEKTAAETDSNFTWQTEQFADLGILRYKINGWDKLTLKQKEFVYYLTQAGLSGRDIIYDTNYKHNLAIRKALENIVANYTGDKNSADWNNFMTYTKRIWVSNGIHHHYASDKFIPVFSKEYFQTLLSDSKTTLSDEIITAMFDPAIDNKKVNLDDSQDLLLTSAVNFYADDVSQKDAEAYYAKMIDKNDTTPVEYGLNSTLIKLPDGTVAEDIWKADGKYGEAIKQIIFWLDKAAAVAENQKQADALKILIEYYQTGDLEKWSEYNLAWTQATEGDIDYIQGFVEVYNDPLSYRGSYESIVQIKDFEASERMKVLADNAQYFEDNSSILPEHKKKDVVGISYNVVNVAGQSGDAAPTSSIGVNLPNSNWVKELGSKSVSLGNIVEAYDNAGGAGLLDEFCYNSAEKERAKEYLGLASKMHTAMHEVIGHASGQINDGVGETKETLKSYASALEEGRADLVSLYFFLDPKLVEWGLLPSIEVGKAQYDNYIRQGLMVQLRRLEAGKEVEESHMRNRQMIAQWCYEKGKAENVIEKKTENGKTYFVINDYDKLRNLFGELLKEVQRIKSEGDYDAGKNLVENYGVKVDAAIHKEVLERAGKLNIPPYYGFIQPVLKPIKDKEGNITDIEVEYPKDFTEQMLQFGEEYSFLNAAAKKM